ncbi:MAG: pilus assembly protein [Sphingosinicella sp.]|uniref:pilus assembly protein n=1 Tax=Sphingosinicella sp. TaxID=1917971 RepID=UPI004038477B
MPITPGRGRDTRRGFLASLTRDTRGNTLAIVAAALLPLTAMVGSGVDMSRAYMAKTRLQSACDAAALAGRRVMQNDTMNSTVSDEARRFFAFNFPQGLYNTASFTPDVSRPSSGTVRVTASTTIPTTIMRMFGFNTLPLDATCDAALNFVNTDIMLVLDVTGSMDRDINGNYTPANSQKKITALRDAVMALYDELRPVQTQLESNGLRLRYGVVPYSTTVNVGNLIRDVNPDYLASSVSYQTRIANFNTEISPVANSPTESTVIEVFNNGQGISRNNCGRFGRNQNFSGFSSSPTSGGGPAPADTWTASFSNNNSAGVDWGWAGAPDTSSNTRSCRRTRTVNTTTYTRRWTYTDDRFEQRTFDTSQYRLGNAVPVAVDVDASDRDAEDFNGNVTTQGSYDVRQLALSGSGVGTSSAIWNGCIEERDTVNTIDGNSGYSIPANAFDLNINLIPHNDATRWRPQWPSVVWRRSSSTSGAQSSAPCPAEARRLQAWNRGQLESYVQHLDPTGNTYHDIGMIWGARMISNAGIFADSTDTFAGMPVSRHIIFMTDGQLEPSSTVYSAYGIEVNDQRITGSSSASGQLTRHMQRFKMACNAARSQGASIWVIAFGTTLSQEMIECASNPNQASTSANRDALIARFREIGSNIGALRLTQ